MWLGCLHREFAVNVIARSDEGGPWQSGDGVHPSSRLLRSPIERDPRNDHSQAWKLFKRPYNPDIRHPYETAYWRLGDQIGTRQLLHEKDWFATPATIVEDSSQFIALYLSERAMPKQPRTLAGTRPTPHELLPGADFVLADSRRTGSSALLLTEPKANSDTFVVWDEPIHTLNQRYINLQTPHERTSLALISLTSFRNWPSSQTGTPGIGRTKMSLQRPSSSAC